ncbi:MAG: GAF domain-containing protein [Gemmatimonadota bacterium]|nr:MAG: GAF domain-containing protein [Gemmatimonadota bacterium]
MADAEAGAQTATPQQLQARIRELEHERKHLLAVIEILEEITGSLHIVDILQGITRKLGETFGLDRCSIYLAEQGERTARLVASYEDPSIRNYVVDLDRYPEVRQALESGETVFIPDAQGHPDLKHVHGLLESRRVKAITVVPISWRGASVGAIFLRTFRDGPGFSDTDVRFVQVIASLVAKALRNAHRYEQLLKQADHPEAGRREDLRRAVLVSFLARLFDTYGGHDDAERLLSRAAGDELDRLVDIAMAVFSEEAKSS